MTIRDVVIIGGGLAGGAAAAQLARHGVDVVVLEKEAQPKHKVCGEFISYEAQDYLQKLNIDIVGLGAQAINRLKLIRGNKAIEAPLGFNALSMSRKYLDEAVLLQAQAQGAEIKLDVTVTSLKRNSSHWHVMCQGHEPILAKAVFLATGKHDLLGVSHRIGQQNNFIGFKMYFQLLDSQQELLASFVKVILFKGGYAGLELVENGIANLCLVVSKNEFASCGKSWERLINMLVQTTPELAACLVDARPCWDKPLSIYGIPYGFVYGPSNNDVPNLFRVGDQMAVIPSLCGDGMAIALHTGFSAANHYINSNANNYHQSTFRQLHRQIKDATVVSRILLSSLLQSTVLPICSMVPGIITTVISRTRIKKNAILDIITTHNTD